MDMLNILKNMDAAAKGEKPAAGKGNANEMKSILESFYRVNESDVAVDECGMGMPPSPPPMPEQDKVKMNVNLNADGIDAIADLIKLMGGKVGDHGEPDGDEMPTLTMPMPKKPEMGPKEPSMGDLIRMSSANDEPKKLTMDDENVDEEWDNAPDEEYADHDTMTKDLSGGINRQKKQFKAAQPGDNAMAVESIKEQLWAALNEKKNCKSKKKVSEGDWYYDFDDPSSGSKGAARKSNTPLWDEYIKDVAEEHPDVKTASDFVKFYGLNEIEEVIAKLKKEGEARKSPRSKKTAQLLQTAHDKMLAKM